MLGNFFMLSLSSADFSKLTFSKNSFRNTIRVSNSLDPDQDRRFYAYGDTWKLLYLSTLSMLGNFFMLLLPSADFFSKLTFPKKSFRNPIRVSYGLDPDQDQHSVGPDLGPNCLQSYQQTTQTPR